MSSDCHSKPFFPYRWRVMLVLVFLLAGLGLAFYAQAMFSDMLGMSNPEFRTNQGITAKPFLNPRFPDRFPWISYPQSWPVYQLLLLGAGVFGLGLALGYDGGYRERTPIRWKTETGLIILLLLIAAFFRGHEAHRFPYGLHYDESTNAMIGQDFLAEWTPERQQEIKELRQHLKEQQRAVRKIERALKGDALHAEDQIATELRQMKETFARERASTAEFRGKALLDKVAQRRVALLDSPDLSEGERKQQLESFEEGLLEENRTYMERMEREHQQRVEAREAELRSEARRSQDETLQRQLSESTRSANDLQAKLDRLEVPVFTRQGFGKATAHMYQIGLAMKWFGTHVWTIRLPTMIAGVLGVLALYLLLRVVTDIPTAFMGAGFLAAMRWHVNFSRIAYDAIEAPLIITATMFLFFLAFKHRGGPTDNKQKPATEGSTMGPWKPWLKHLLVSAPLWAAAGYVFGLSIYSYKPLYLFPGILAGFLFFRWCFQRELVRWNLVGLVIFAALAFLSAKEMLDYRTSHPEAFSERLNMVSIIHSNESIQQNLDRVVENLKLTLRMFNVRGDSNPRHNHSLAPMVHPLLGALWPLGLIWSLVWLKSRLGLLSLGWFVAMLLPGILSIEAPQALRTLCVMPVIAIFGAVALRQPGLAMGKLLTGWFPNQRWLHTTARALGWGTVGVIVSIYSWGEFNLYYKDQVRNHAPYVHFDGKFVDMAHWVNEQQGNFYCVGDANGHNALRLLNPPGTWRNHLFLQQELPAHGDPDQDSIFVVMEPWNRPDKMEWIEWLYGPEVGPIEPTDDFGNHIFTAYRVPADIREAHQGFGVAVAMGDPCEATAHITLKRLETDPTNMDFPTPYRMDGQSMWVIPEGSQGATSFRLETEDPFELRIDGSVVLSTTGSEGLRNNQIQLDAGAHQVQFTHSSASYQSPTTVHYRGPRDGDWRLLGEGRFHDKGMLPGGLRLKYWHGSRTWKGVPLFVWADPFINYRWNPPYRFPLSMEWTGEVQVTEPGNYKFTTIAWDYADIEINGEQILATPNGGEQRKKPITGQINLAKGWHNIRIRYSDNIGGGEYLKVLWTTPSGHTEVLPQSVLRYQ